MKRIIIAAIIAIAFAAPARADRVGAVIGGTTGLFLAGPPGAIIGVIVGAIFGKPWWGPDQSSYKCWIDDNFHRHCPKFPLN